MKTRVNPLSPHYTTDASPDNYCVAVVSRDITDANTTLCSSARPKSKSVASPLPAGPTSLSTSHLYCIILPPEFRTDPQASYANPAVRNVVITLSDIREGPPRIGWPTRLLPTSMTIDVLRFDSLQGRQTFSFLTPTLLCNAQQATCHRD